MARSLTGAMVTAITAGTVKPILLARIETASGNILAWNGSGDLLWGADTYKGLGDFGGVSPVQETSELQAAGISFQLSGVPGTMISLALQSIRWGKPAKLWLGLFDTATGSIVADPYLVFSGYTDVPEINESGENAVITLSAENRLIDLKRPRARRYTHEDQQLIEAGDKGFEYVQSLQDKTITWGVG